MHRRTRHSSPCLRAMAILYRTPFPFPLLFNSYGDAAVPFYLELPSVSPCKGTLLPHVHLPFHQEAQGPFLQHCIPAGWPPASWLFLPGCRTLNFPLLSFTRVLSAHFSSVLRSLRTRTTWCISHPPSAGSSPDPWARHQQ